MRAIPLCALLLALSGNAWAGDPLTIDTHVDIPSDYMREPRFDVGSDTDLRVDLGKMERGGLDAAFFVVYVEQGPRTPAGYARAIAQAERKYSAIELMLARYPDRIRLATTPAQVRANHDAGVLSAMIGIENGYSLGLDLANLDAAYQRGARYLGLTHTGHNDICTSSGARPEFGDEPARDVGLSDFGRQVVRRANTVGMMVDVSHASDACVRDVLAVSTAPVIASHSSARALADHPRNLDDGLLRAIARQGGVVQVVAYTYFLKPDPAREAAEAALAGQVARDAGAEEFDSDLHGHLPAYVAGMERIEREYPIATLEDYLDHIDHAVQVAGIDHVGIASDFDGGGAITGWMDASETANVTAGLRRRGYGEADIARLWGGNLLRVWEDAERVAGQGGAGAPYDRIVDAVMARYDLPGLALGVIEDGEVVYRGTRGETIAGSGEAIDPDTVFKIASNTKAMTAALLARLVDAGKLRWDDPVTKHLPPFRMHDAWVTREMQVRDLLIHNAGLREGAGDLMLWPEPNRFTRDDIIAGLAHLKPQRSFRSGYAYDNLLYVVAGEVAAAAGGASYEQLVRREVFEPLGLERCRVGEFERDVLGNVAQPHARGDAGNAAMRLDPPQVPAITSAAAGGIRCSLDDMLAWARNWLAPTPAQLEWLPADRRAELWTAHTAMPVSGRRRDWDATRFHAYGYGWRLADIDGQWSVSHTGTLGGMYSQLHLLPDLGDGFIFMINGDADQARTVLNQVLVEHLTPDGEARSVAQVAAALDERSVGAEAAPALPDTSSRRPAIASAMAQWLGTWRDPWFGEVTICPAGDRVVFRSAKSPRLSGDLMRVGDRHLVEWHADHAEAWADFTEDGEVRRLSMAKVDPGADFSYDYEDLAFRRTGQCPAVAAGPGRPG